MADSNIQLVSAMVAPAGDQWTEIYRHDRNPLTWPEVLVLRTMHGEDAVRDLQHAGWAKRTAKEERERLTRLYGKIVTTVFPGNSPRMEMDGGDEVAGDRGMFGPEDDGDADRKPEPDPDPPRNVDRLDHRGRERHDERAGAQQEAQQPEVESGVEMPRKGGRNAKG